MSTCINMISCVSSISFLLNDSGNYFCCTIPRFDVPAFSEVLELFMDAADQEIKHPFETSSMKGEMYSLGEFIIIEASSTEGQAQFRMMLESDVVKRLRFTLYPEFEKSVRIFGKPPNKSFSWQIYNSAEKL